MLDGLSYKGVVEFSDAQMDAAVEVYADHITPQEAIHAIVHITKRWGWTEAFLATGFFGVARQTWQHWKDRTSSVPAVRHRQIYAVYATVCDLNTRHHAHELDMDILMRYGAASLIHKSIC